MKTALLELASARPRMYRQDVTVNPVNGRRGPNLQKAHKRPKTSLLALFLCSQCRSMVAAVRGTPSGVPGFPFAPVREPAYSCHLPSRRGDSWQLHSKRSFTMHTRNPSPHAAAWKARAFAALHSNSSLSVRVARYNAAMARARALEAQGGAQ